MELPPILFCILMSIDCFVGLEKFDLNNSSCAQWILLHLQLQNHIGGSFLEFLDNAFLFLSVHRR